MGSGLRLARIARIDVFLDWSLLIIFALVTFSLWLLIISGLSMMLGLTVPVLGSGVVNGLWLALCTTLPS